MKYLTENTMLEKIEHVFPDTEIIRNRKIQNSKCNGRPDFYLPETDLVIEFDGYLHYSNVATMLRDVEKDQRYSDIGIKVVRIPYFIQWSKELILQEFNIVSDVKQTYPHGFIDDKAMLPANFCELGIEKFQKDLNHFKFAKDSILKSIQDKIKHHKNKLLVIPPSFMNWI